MTSLNTPSSSSTLWATASKEWVIQPKPKPGRKPKKDPPILPQDDAEVDIKGRRIQNRAAQRAFRERKQSQLSELQARIQLYEQGEIERNVALQNIAKRLKEDNEKLRSENTALQEKLADLELRSKPPASQTINQVKKKRWRDDSPSSTVLPSQNKKSRTSLQPPQHAISSSDTHLPSPSSMVSSPESSDTMDAHFPASYDTQSDMLNRASFDNFNNMASEVKADDVLSSFSSLGCGYCDGGAICLCHEISVHDVVERTIDSAVLKNNDFNGHIVSHNVQDTNMISPQEPAQGSILDNLPAYQPPLPLRLRRRSGGVPVNSIFPVTSIAESSTMNATCSGDPSNCAACGDDAFGKAFCSAIGNTGSNVCNNCPSQAPSNTTNSGCCGTGSCGNCPSASTFSSGGPMPNSQYVDSSEYIATNDAWKKLKAHPNVHFADLSLLAEVVASRSKCLGPQLQIPSQISISHSNDTSTQFTDTQSFTHQRGKSPPLQLVPQEVLLECGRRRMRHVHADGVKEALRLLDAKFS